MRPGRVALFGVAIWCLYLAAPQPFNPNGGDNLWYVPTAVSLVRGGTLDLSRYRADLAAQRPADVWFVDLDADMRITHSGAQRLNRFPIGPSLLALPLVALVSSFESGQPSLQQSFRLAALMAATTAAASVLLLMALVWLLTRDRRLTWTLGLFHALASPNFSAHHSAFWSHNALQPFVLLALLLMAGRGGRDVWLAPLPLAFAYATRADAAIFIAVYSAAVALWFRHAAVRYFTLLGAALAVFFAWSWHIFGVWRPPYYGLIPGAPVFSLDALAGTLVSPNRGLFIFTPVYLLSAAGAALALAHPRRHHPIYPLAAIAVCGQWLAIAILNPYWWGGFSYGPRLFCPVLPLLTLLVVPAVDEIGRRGWWQRRGARLIVGAALAWSLFVQARGAFASGPHEWNYEPIVDLHHEQLWNWTDLQIVRQSRKIDGR